MCLQIIHHTLNCDVRPVMTLPTNPPRQVVNPFQAPRISCDCPPPAHPTPQKTNLRCPHHGCCSVSSRFFPCGCGNIITYHNYIQRPLALAAPGEEGAAPVPWRQIPSIDEEQQQQQQQQAAAGGSQWSSGDHARASEELRIARRGMRFVGSELKPKTDELVAALAALGAAEREHAAEHAPCARVLNDGECPADRRVNRLRGDVDRIRGEAELLRTCYRSWKRAAEQLRRQEFGKVGAVEMA